MMFNGTKTMLSRMRSLGLLALAGSAGLLGCLDRPVAGTNPETNNIFVKRNPSGGIDKIDLLFMIDNSLSMGDKQAVLAAAVPQLLTRLTNPDCVSEDGATRQPMGDSLPTDDCPAGLTREFTPVRDIHIGVVSSSLGDYGTNACPESSAESADAGMASQNDHGWLLGALPRTGGSLGADFLSWTASNADHYGDDIDTKKAEFANFVTAVEELGCGYEMALESWYRFLIDPTPPSDVGYNVDANGSAGQSLRMDVSADGTDWGEPILAQRRAFLRSDSLVGVIMMADENDCSLKDSGAFSWKLTSTSEQMYRASSKCAEDPNDECCFSCLLGGVPGGGVSDACLATDPTCTYGGNERLASADDSTNLRCWHQKQRFGYDFLFPVTRYSNALSLKQICPNQTYGDLDCDCTAAKALNVPCDANGSPVDNPLYANLSGVLPTGPDRDDPSVVFFAGIVGVPWQDLATEATLTDDTALEYKTATQLEWEMFAPLNEFAAPPTDPLMIESVLPRTGANPVTGDALVTAEAAGASRRANPINGHEYNPVGDLQFACTFSLEGGVTVGSTTAVRDCSPAAEDACADAACERKAQACSCGSTQKGVERLSPLCQDEAGAYTTTQTYAKAYPGVRELQALRAFHELNVATAPDNAIVASICPKSLDATLSGNSVYGYNAAVQALVERLKTALVGSCLPRPLAVADDGTVPCSVVEVIDRTVNEQWCSCADKGRDDLDSDLADAILSAAKTDGLCDTEGGTACSNICMCQLKQLVQGTDAGNACLTEAGIEKTAAGPGYCYVDPAQEDNADLAAAETAIVASCPATQKRLIRIVGKEAADPNNLAAPAPGVVVIACAGAAYTGE